LKSVNNALERKAMELARDIKELEADDKRLSGEIEKNVGSAKDVQDGLSSIGSDLGDWCSLTCLAFSE
jgi:hypothetical protein